VSTTPIAKRPERFSQTRCRYACDAEFGAASMDELGAQSVLDAIVAFADAMGGRAGIALWPIQRSLRRAWSRAVEAHSSRANRIDVFLL